MLNSVPYVYIWKCIGFFLVDHQVLKNAQKCSQTNLLASNRAFFSILVENLQISEKKWSANFQNSQLFAGYDIFRVFNKICQRDIEASSRPILTCDTALEPQSAVLALYEHPQVCAHIRHIVGIHQAHRHFSQKIQKNWDSQKSRCAWCVPTMCLVCAHTWGCS